MNEYDTDTYISLAVSMSSTHVATLSAHLVCLIFELAHVREKVGHPIVYKIAAHKLDAFVMSHLRQILLVKWW